MTPLEIRQKISNHPNIKDLEREVVVYRVADNMDVRQMTISARVEHFSVKGKERKLLPEFTKEITDWIISNEYEVKLRDEKNQVVLNEEGEEVKIPAFEMFQQMILKLLLPTVKIGILNDDEEIKRFDQ